MNSLSFRVSRRLARIGLVLLLALTLPGCHRIKALFVKEDLALDPCDPISNHYEGDRHFIERDFVTNDRNIDYRKMFEADKVYNSPCDPIRGRIHKKAEE